MKFPRRRRQFITLSEELGQQLSLYNNIGFYSKGVLLQLPKSYHRNIMVTFWSQYWKFFNVHCKKHLKKNLGLKNVVIKNNWYNSAITLYFILGHLITLKNDSFCSIYCLSTCSNDCLCTTLYTGVCIGINRSPLSWNDGNYPIIILFNTCYWLYMYINWFTRIQK